eukprot:MONOS_11279.1-p1 / transcript=MONOS_11279.1 / gene=MONOS_11279 / organism=Monocercomonoides_exilis_PA203 / gene_product=unspecified product / transcript_product=unspecified product / location=Mono_scaffold00558:4772-6089(-) / protein_length=289 / sequence_SO=supercontig / SO=protein_coding / is_pseudo=false
MEEGKILKSQFEGKTFYEALDLNKDATEAEIRKAYYKKALLCHPDKNPENQEAVHSDIDDLPPHEQLSLILERFNAHKPTKDDFEDFFASRTSGNEEELKDLKENYIRFKGNMKKAIQYIIGCEKEDLPRLCAQIEEWIKEGEVKEYPDFRKTKVGCNCSGKSTKKNKKLKNEKKLEADAKKDHEEDDEEDEGKEDLGEKDSSDEDEDEEEEEDFEELDDFIVDDDENEEEEACNEENEESTKKGKLSSKTNKKNIQTKFGDTKKKRLRQRAKMMKKSKKTSKLTHKKQ